MNLTPKYCEVIAEHPLGSILDRARGILRTSYALVDDETAFALVNSLQKSPVAESLKPPGLGDPLKLYLSKALGAIDKLPLDKFRPLAAAVNDGYPDDDVWDAALDLVQKLVLDGHIHERPATPPESQAEIPSSRSVALLVLSAHSESPKLSNAMINLRILNQVQGCVYRNVPGFFAKYFDERVWSDHRKNLRDVIKTNLHQGVPTDTDEWSMVTWLARSIPILDATSRFDYSKQKQPVGERETTEVREGGPKLCCARKGPHDFYFYRRDRGGEFDWESVLVVGEFKKGTTADFRSVFEQTTGYVNKVFYAQPHRCFVPAFTIRESIMELWVYDRSGPISSEEFDIFEETVDGKYSGLTLLANALATYATISDIEAGYDSRVRPDQIELAGETLKLGKEPIFKTSGIVSRGTVCFSTTYFDQPAVAKLAWLVGDAVSEARLLKLANIKGVHGICKLEAWGKLNSTDALREQLDFTNAKPHSFNQLSRDDGNIGLNWISEEICSSASNQVGESNQGLPQADSHYVNRTQVCLVISPVGSSIYATNKPSEVVKIIRDAVVAHQSLCLDANILHRDISASNILARRVEDQVEGLLIDLDHAKILDTDWQTQGSLDKAPEGVNCRTGTVMFMAYGVLEGNDHTYRHDIESFYYVLLFLCLRLSQSLHRRELQSEATRRSIEWISSELVRWETGSVQDLLSQRSRLQFQILLDKQMFPMFHRDVPLQRFCSDFRAVLFGDSGYTGTPKQPRVLYNQVISLLSNEVTD